MVVTRSGGKRRKTSGNKYYFNENDFISRLPDGILLSILEKLPVRDFLRASAVARRWEHLWKSVSTLDVNDRMEKDGGKNAKKFLTSFIKNNQSDKLKRFSVLITNNGNKSAAYKWMAFAVSKKVEELNLQLYITEVNWRTKAYPIVQLPEDLFKCSSLVNVSLTFANLDPLPSFHLPSLKSLQLDRCQLPDNGVEIITANCPLLNLLVLSNCNKDTDLKITVASHSNLSTIIVYDKDRLIFGQSPETSISAPKVKTLSIMGNTNMRKYSLDNVTDVVEATLDLLEFNKIGIFYSFEHRMRMNIGKILEKLVHARKLRLCTRCILTTVAMRERHLEFKLTRLELNTHLREKELIGISLLFRACPQLEELVVNIIMPPVLYLDHDEGNERITGMMYHPSKSLTFVEFKNLNGCYQTWDKGKFSIRMFFQGCENVLWLMKLLKPSLVQRFIFTTSQQQIGTTALSKACPRLEELVVNIRLPQVLYLDHNEVNGVNTVMEYHPLKRLIFCRV